MLFVETFILNYQLVGTMQGQGSSSNKTHDYSINHADDDDGMLALSTSLESVTAGILVTASALTTFVGEPEATVIAIAGDSDTETLVEACGEVVDVQVVANESCSSLGAANVFEVKYAAT
jgi:hypothetical protein